MEEEKEIPTFGTQNIDVSALDSISNWLLQEAGKSHEQVLAEERMKKIRLPRPLIPEDFDPSTLPNISDVPNIVYVRPVWMASNLGGLQRLIRAEFLARFRNLDQVRAVFGKSWLSTDDAFEAFKILLGRGQCSLGDLRNEDAQMLGMTPDQFEMFCEFGVCITCASNEMREAARTILRQTSD